MKILSVYITHYGDTLSGGVTLVGDGHTINTTLSDGETHELAALALEIWQRKQAAVAKSIADMQPLQLAAPEPQVVEAEWTPIA